MVGEVATAAIGGATHVVQTVARQLIIDRMDTDWKITFETTLLPRHLRVAVGLFLNALMVKRLAQLAKDRSIWGFTKSDLNRASYAESPILSRMNTLTFGGGDVRVAYAASGFGKTTACRAFLRAGRNPPGIAFCVNQENTKSYAASMLKFLNLVVDNPPEGWMISLLGALKGQDEPAFLILDDFMYNGATEDDKTFLLCLKSLIRASTVTAIVLTSNKDAAAAMLAMNGMESIVPMVHNKTVIKMQRDFNNGTFAMDWNKELKVQWSTKALQIAAAVDPRHKHLKTDEMHNKVKDYLDSLGLDYRKLAIPGDIHHVLMTELDPPTPLSAHGDHLIVTFDSVEEKSGFGVCGTSSCGDNCLVM
jgi:hypothetical protein